MSIHISLTDDRKASSIDPYQLVITDCDPLTTAMNAWDSALTKSGECLPSQSCACRDLVARKQQKQRHKGMWEPTGSRLHDGERPG